MQRQDLLKKYGPVAIMQAIDDVADFVGDTEEIGSSDVSGWIKQIEKSLGANDLEEALDPEKKERLDALIDLYTDATDPESMLDVELEPEDIINAIRKEFGDKTADSVANGPSMHFPRPGHSMGHDDLEFKQMRKNLYPNRITKAGKLHKQDNDAMKRDIKDKLDVEEGMMDTVKKVGSKVFDKLGGGSEEDLLKDLQKKAGIPSHAQHGKPNMAKPKEEEVDESALQAWLGDKKYGEDGMDALRKAGQEHASEKEMQNIRAHYSKKEEPVAEEVDTGQYDAVKSSPKGDNDQNWDKPFREKIKQYAKELEKRQKEKEQGVAESEFAGDYATGEAGQWRNKGPKANKPATIGDLVGEGQDDLDTIKRLVRK
jgi:hypothetical protein